MFDPGSTGFKILGAMLVFLMTPALAFFLWRPFSPQKNVLNTMCFMSIAVIGFVGVLWIMAGWSSALRRRRQRPSSAVSTRFSAWGCSITCWAAAIWRFPRHVPRAR